jgi:F-type H+-transporting ATPase subunit epsilon
MKVEILSPGKTLFEGNAKMVSLPGSEGGLGILNNHSPLITTLKKGTIKLELSGGDNQNFEVNGGTVEVNNNKVIILTD